MRSFAPLLQSSCALCAVLLLGTTTLLASTWVEVTPDGALFVSDPASARAPQVQLLERDDTGLSLAVRLHGVEIGQELSPHGDFLRVTCPRTPLAGDVGAPALPVIRRLFCVPPGAEPRVQIEPSAAVRASLDELGLAAPVAPMQGPLSMDWAASRAAAGKAPLFDPGIPPLTASSADFHFSEEVYAADVVKPQAPVRIVPAGIARGIPLYALEVHPVGLVPATGELLLTPSMTVRIDFVGGQGFAGERDLSYLGSAILNPPPAARTDAGHILIVTAPLYTNSAPLTQFVDFKTSQGFTVEVYEPPLGIWNYELHDELRALWGTEDEPDYLVFIGDALRGTGTVTTEAVPTRVGSGLKNSVGDVPYACMDGENDWFPDIPHGRIAVRTVAELQNVMNKILYVETGEYADPTHTERAVFIAGEDSYSDGEAIHNEVIADYFLPLGLDVNRVYAYSYGATTQDVTDAFHAGCFLASYFGHAYGFQGWASPMFLRADLEALSNENLYPLVLSFSCSPARFDYLEPERSPGWLEQWLKEPTKGAAAGYGCATNQTPYGWEEWHNLYRFLFQSMYGDDVRTLGPAVIATAAHFTAFYGPEDPASHDFTEGWYLLGDPTMHLPDDSNDNYLIVTADEYMFSTPLNQFVTHKENLGFNVETYVATPGMTNTDIRDYIRSKWDTPDAYDYVLLIGDTDGFSATTDCVPHFEGGGSKHAATDWPYGCMDDGDDWYPDIPVGRFSVRDVATLQAVVDKTIFVESGDFPDPDYVKRGAFLANPSTYGQAEPTHDWVIENYFAPNNYDGIKLYAAEGADTSDVTAAVNNGALFTLYFGHSSSSGWWDPGFNASNVYNLSNTGLYGIAFGWSCNTARYTEGECFGEAWLRAEDKGAAAYISASNYIYWGSVEAWEPSVVHEKAFFAAFFEDQIWNLGPAWMSGLYRFLTEYGEWDGNPNNPPSAHADECRNFFEEFVILGDPSLRLPQNSGFTLQGTPEELEVCAPDTGQYIINVERTGDFAETVSLSVNGLPEGATASFTVNAAPPPYTSVLTIDNTDAVTPGVYEIQVLGDASSLSRVQPLTLAVSDNDPGNFALLSPPDGAADVGRSPTLIWDASSQASTYLLEVADDPQFLNLVYTATTTEATHQVGSMLSGGTTYYWRVRADNGCGTTGFTPGFSFTTVDQMEYYTEQYEGADAFDLDGYTVLYQVDGSASHYQGCLMTATELPTDPTGGTAINLGDDDHEELYPSLAVPFYGTAYTSFYVNSNGNITFDASDHTYNESLEIHFAHERISALFDDLNPANGGTVSWKETGELVAITFEEVPEYPSDGANTFQIELFFSGDIRITWLGIDSADSIVGLSQGDGIPDDYIEIDNSQLQECGLGVGACCIGEICGIFSEDNCIAVGGIYQGDGTDCEPNPCLEVDATCLIISEVVQGYESGDCPRWMEITNTGSEDFTFTQGGLIVQTDDSTDVQVDVDLTGVTIPAGASFVLVSNFDGACTGAFDAVYQVSADFYTNIAFGYGNERLILTDKADGSHLIDIYGEFGVDGTGQPWEFTRGYAYRVRDSVSGTGGAFVPGLWFFGGVGSLEGDNPTQLLLDFTTPGTHLYSGQCNGLLLGDMDCDGDVDFDDISPFVVALSGADAYYAQYIGCNWYNADCNEDATVNFDDIAAFVDLLSSGF